MCIEMASHNSTVYTALRIVGSVHTYPVSVACLASKTAERSLREQSLSGETLFYFGFRALSPPGLK